LPQVDCIAEHDQKPRKSIKRINYSFEARRGKNSFAHRDTSSINIKRINYSFDLDPCAVKKLLYWMCTYLVSYCLKTLRSVTKVALKRG